LTIYQTVYLSSNFSVVLLIASTMICVCAYREGMKVANATRSPGDLDETVTRSTHAYGEPGNPANALQARPQAGQQQGGRFVNPVDRLNSSEVAYIAPLPPPYAHPPTITANIYPDNPTNARAAAAAGRTTKKRSKKKKKKKKNRDLRRKIV
jgi:hypothetical protein